MEQELDWTWVDPRDGIRSNSGKYQGNPSKGELLHNQNCTEMDELSVGLVSFPSLDRFDEHLRKCCGNFQNLKDTGILGF